MPWATLARAGVWLLRSRRGRKLLIWLSAGAVVAVVAVVLIPVIIITSTLGMCMNTYEQVEDTGFVSSEPSGKALSDIPDHYLSEYREAAEKYGIDWAVLAGVGQVETKHGEGGKKTTCINSSVGAQGPMQFMPSTWASQGVDANGDGKRDVCYYEDAIHAAAKKLSNDGAPESYRDALYAYNHSESYVDDVLAKAKEYRGQSEGGSTDGGGTIGPSTQPEKASAPGGAVEMERVQQQGTGEPPQGWDLVDGQRQIDYRLESAYREDFKAAVSEWNDLGGVKIKPTDRPSDTDLVVTDGDAGEGIGNTSSGGKMTFDTALMEEATDNARKAVAAHELGHGLGFVHTEKESVMATPVITNRSNNPTSPTDYDREVYKKVWGGGGGDSDGGGESADGGSPGSSDGVGSGSTPAFCKAFGVIRVAGKVWDFADGPDGPGPNASYDGEVPPPDASYTTDNGFKLKPPASQAAPVIEEKFNPLSVETYEGHGSGGDAALAVDFMVAPYGEKATGAQKQKGDAIAAFAVENYDAFHIKSIIWYERIYTASGWGPYTEEMARKYNSTTPAASRDYESMMHHDHVHIQFDPSGEPIESVSDDGGGGGGSEGEG